jgi:hypothetical protein
MIHHISMPANEPKHVAEVLAELMDGRCYPFIPVPDSFMAVSGDEHGTMIEVYPADMTLEVQGMPKRKPGHTLERGAFHVLLSVPLSVEKIEAIGKREGWTTAFLGRGVPGQKPFFHLVEMWVENHFMLEVVPQDMLAEYENLIRFETLEKMMAPAAE